MVSPDSRTMLTAALKPPPGMAFDAAVATTYTLDPALALMLPVLFSQGTVSKKSCGCDIDICAGGRHQDS